jgi:hypothetical protein
LGTGSPFEEISFITIKEGLPTETEMGGSIVSVVLTVAAGALAATVEANEKRLRAITVSAVQTRKRG